MVSELVAEIPFSTTSHLQALRSSTDRITVTTKDITIHHGRYLNEPLQLPARTITVAATEYDSSDSRGGRFAVLRRIGESAVIPFEEGIEGWLWTGLAGSALPVLADDRAPNVALIFAHPLREGVVRTVFAYDFVETLSQSSPLGVPTVLGLLLSVTDVSNAKRAFARLGLNQVISDREIPPPLRRSLPDDKRADPQIATLIGRSPEESQPPPGA
jgi:hypothetical protein